MSKKNNKGVCGASVVLEEVSSNENTIRYIKV
jgi:hypothetical protein